MGDPQHIAGQVIGRGGQTVNRLMRESRAKIVLETYQDRTGHDVVITGPAAAVQVGLRPVQKLYCRCLLVLLFRQRPTARD